MGRHSSESPPPRVRGRSPVSSSRGDRERDRDKERSPSRRHRYSHSHKQDVSPVKDWSISPPPSEKRHHSSRGSLRPARESSGSPVAPTHSRSPSPLTKRVRRAQADRESEQNHGSGRGTDRDRGRDRGRGSDRDLVIERKEKRSSGRDEVDDNHNDSSRKRSSRSRHERPTTSPENNRNGRNRHRSLSPLMARDEETYQQLMQERDLQIQSGPLSSYSDNESLFLQTAGEIDKKGRVFGMSSFASQLKSSSKRSYDSIREDKRVKALEQKVMEQGNMISEMRELLQALLKDKGAGLSVGGGDDQTAAV